MTVPLVSIVIPTYNREHLLIESINNALKQTYQNIEIVIIDDGSQDGTKAFMQDYQNPKVSYFYKANGGPSTARNEGIRRAKGAYIAFMDSDDLWDPYKLEAQVKFFESNLNAGMVTTNYRFIDAAGSIVKEPGKAFGYTTKNGFIHDITAINFPIATTSTFMVRKYVFETVGMFNESLGISEDLDLWVRIGLKFEVGYIDEVLVSVRLHEDHLMRQTPRYQVWHQSVKVLESHRKEILKHVPQADIYFAQFFARAGNIALLGGLRTKAFYFYFNALIRRPNSLAKYKDVVRCMLPLSYLIWRYEKAMGKEIENRTMQMYR
jgi:glycosyltransferase involved in cell wall biosynthesis